MREPNRRDIYTLEPIGKDSIEHVLLDSLGGRLKLPGILDKRTNDVFGRTIDAAFSRFASLIRTLLGIKSGSGGAPPKLKDIHWVFH